MKLTLIFSLLLLSTIAFANKSEDRMRANFCASQVAATIASVYDEKAYGLKKPVINEKIDQEYVILFKELKVLSENKAEQGKVLSILDKVIILNKKHAAKEMKACVDWFTAFTKESMKLCANLDEKDPEIQNKVDKCNETSSNLPSVKKKFTKWTELQKNLVSLKKK